MPQSCRDWQKIPFPESTKLLQHSFIQLNRLRLCIDLGRSLSKNQSLEAILQRLMESTMHTLGAQNCTLFLTDQSQASMRLVLSRGPIGSLVTPGRIIYKGQGIPGRVFATGKPLLIQSNDLLYPGDILAETPLENIQTTLCLPIAFETQVLGVAKLTNTCDNRPFNKDDQEIFSYVCDQAGIAIHNVYVRENELALQSMEEEMERAADVHQVLFPRTQPKLAGFDITGSSLSCHKVGGDYYDFLHIDDAPDSLALIVADAVGHGISAALLMASLRAYCRSHRHLLHDPGCALTRINSLYCEDAYESAFFCTAFLLVIDTTQQTLSWACAGHPPVLFYDPAKDDFFELRARGIPLGCDKEYVYTSQTSTACSPGQICCIGTDGIWEETNAAGELFGRERLQNIIRANKNRSSSEICLAIRTALTDFIGETTQEDDITMVIIKRIEEKKDIFA